MLLPSMAYLKEKAQSEGKVLLDSLPELLMRFKQYSLVLLLICLLFQGCEMDPYLFNTEKLSNYNLPETVIPAAKRDFVSFTSQGKRLYGFYVHSDSSVAATKNLTVLYFHGNKHHLGEYWDRVELLFRAGYSVFIFDYQQFGMSEGTASEGALYADAEAAYQYLMDNYKPAAHTVLFYGYSLGGAAAINLAVSRKPAALILESAFASGEVLIQSGTLLDIPGDFLLSGTYDNKGKIRSIQVPVTILHGIEDSFIDIDKNGAVLFQNANNPKRFIRVAGANHTNVPEKMGIDNYLVFLQQLILFQ